MRGKIEKAKLGAFLEQEMRARREALAVDVFGPEMVREACTAAARQGYSTCTIKPPLPLNLRNTQAAASLLLWLEREGLQFDWNQGRDTPDGPTYPRLNIRWE